MYVRMSKIDDLFNMKGKVVLITGGTGLLGLEYAKILSSAGANIVLVDLDENKCKEKARELEKEFGNKMLGVKTDISNQKEVKSNSDISLKEKLIWFKDLPDYPSQDNAHDALDDAKWNFELYKFIKNHK